MVRNESPVLIALKKAKHDFMAVEALLAIQKTSATSGTSSINHSNPCTHSHPDIMAQAANQLAAAIRQLDIVEQAEEAQSRLGHVLGENPQSQTASADTNTVGLSGHEYDAYIEQTVHALHESEEKFRLIIEAAPVAIVITNATGQITLINREAEKLFGYAPDEIVGQKVEILLPEQMRQQHTNHRGNYYSEAEAYAVRKGRDFIALRKDGTTCLVEIDLSHIETQSGKLVISFIVDVSERKEQERQLQFDAKLQESVSEAVIATDLNFHIQSWNRVAERIYGWTADEVIGKSPNLLRTQFAMGATIESMQRDLLKNGSWTDEVIQYHKDGNPISILSSVVLFKDEAGNPIGIVSVNHDITARKEADEDLQIKIENELEFQIYLKALHEISIELTQIDNLNDFYRRAVELGLEHLGFERLALFLYDKDNKEAIGTYGTSIDGLITDERSLHFPPDPLGVMMRTFQQAERFCFDDNIDLHHDLKPIGKGWNASAALWDGTQSIGWLIADNFIHKQPASKALLDTLALYAMTIGTLLARKQTDAALRDSESRYRLLAENISDVIIRISPTGDILYVSPSSLTVLGYKPEDMIGRSGFDFLNADDAVMAVERLTQSMTGNAPPDSLLFRFLHKQGHVIWVEATGRIMCSAETGEIQEFIASLRDISLRKHAEEAIQQAFEKEKELGELKSRFVSMTSHEFRTPLANILAMTETLMSYRQKMTGAQIEQRLDNIRGQVDHLKDIIEDVLQITRIDMKRVEYNPQKINLDTLCKEIISEFDNRTDVPQELIYRAQNLPVELNLDKKLMRQMINNLISNAVKYSPTDKPVRVSIICNAATCILTVCDEGIGIPEADLKHMFEPFHRAANVGSISGTGLGLIIARRAVELHNGTIAIESKVGRGTTITVEIPLDA